MIERLPAPLRLLLDWQRRRFFREEEWRVTGRSGIREFHRVVEEEADDGLPLLMTLPKFRFNKAFVGRIRDQRIALKHRTLPALWLIGPGSYYFSGRIAESADHGIELSGAYRLRPTLAWMYYVYLTTGFAFIGLSLLAIAGGTAAWSILALRGATIPLAGLKMMAVSAGFLMLGWGHITLEKWLDGRNRRAVIALLKRAAGAA